MQIVSSAVVDARSEREAGPLNLAILPPFGAAWLAPRLWELASERPRLAINFAARAEPFDFESATIDAAIYLGKPDWPGADRKSVVDGNSVSVRVDLGGRRIIKKKISITTNTR